MPFVQKPEHFTRNQIDRMRWWLVIDLVNCDDGVRPQVRIICCHANTPKPMQNCCLQPGTWSWTPKDLGQHAMQIHLQTIADTSACVGDILGANLRCIFRALHIILQHAETYLGGRTMHCKLSMSPTNVACTISTVQSCSRCKFC
jgi:hypothetical protein